MKLSTRIAIVLFLGTAALSCSILKSEDPEKNVRDFLTSFQTDLSKSDDEILAKFHVPQSREAVLMVISVLQNKDPFIVCDASIAGGLIMFENELVKVEIPTSFRVKELDTDDTASFTLRLWLKHTENGYQITQLNGEEFYQAFSKVKNNNQWLAEEKMELQKRLWIYENAAKLEPEFDSVIWYTTYKEQNYFYVVEGDWNNYFLSYETRNQKNTNTKMGLVNAQGEIIIPIEYDLIGTIAFERADVVEVIKNGKVGYFNMATKKLVVETSYDQIIPYHSNGIWAVVKSDSTYGWLNDEFQYQPGFSSPRVEQWINNFEFLKQNIKLAKGQQYFCEIPAKQYAGSGIIIPPTYLSKYGIFGEIEGGISTASVPITAWTDYKEVRSSIFETISDNISAVVTSIRERYLEGREEFYDFNTILFVNDQRDTLGMTTISGQELSLRTIDSTLLEIRTPHDYWFGEYDAAEEGNLLSHSYLRITPGNGIVELKTERKFPQTQFVMLDSSYLTGNFTVYNRELEKEVNSTFLSVKTITFMRDEILASYGYQFPEKEKLEHFVNIHNGYLAVYTTLEEFQDQLTEIDKHNLAFLNKILALLNSPTPA